MADPAAPAPQDAEALLESSWGRRGAPLPRRERLIEAALTVLLLAVCVALLRATSLTAAVDLAVIPVLVAYAASISVVFPVGAGFTTPSQLFLVPLFALAPAPVVPLLVVTVLVLARLADVALGRTRMDRLVVCGGNAIYTVGPALVLTAAGRHDFLAAPVPLLIAAFAAQLLFDLASGVMREWLASGVRPQLQLRVQAQVWAVDAALTPLGLLAAYAGARVPGASVALWPLVMLLGHMARDRERRIARAHERLQALERERARLRVAVHRIGDAFASNLDLDALLQIVTRACVDALDADAGRATVGHGGRRVARVQVGEDAGLGRVMDAAEHAAVERGELVSIGEEGDWVLSAPLGAGLASHAAVAVARRGEAFAEQERELFDHLCAQASVSAANVDRHHTLHRQAITDELTGLANHRRLQEVLSGSVEAHERTGATASLVLFDLDNFKRVNDTHGHQTGDMVLRAVARCLREHSSPGDEVARYGGEELAIVLPDTGLERAHRVADDMRARVEALSLRTPDDTSLPVTVSGGVATLGTNAPTATALIAAADEALYEAKAAGKNRIRAAAPRVHVKRVLAGSGAVGHGGDAADAGHVDGPDALRRAIEKEELELHYQPKVTLPDGRPVGVEALLRWHHPRRGLLRPAAFLELLSHEEVGPAVTRWVMRRALTQAVAWRRGGLALPVAVNITGRDLADPDFPAAVARCIAETGAVASDLRLEITEQTVIISGDGARAALGQIRAMGVGISLDDFGTGHSSLMRLRHLPVDELKLDRGFLRSADADVDLAIIRAAVSLGRDLDLKVVAEGIEDARHWHLLSTIGCDLAQGFFVAPALRPAELDRWLADRRSRPVA
jgi:diguanylate cyclase (GGDEF)-like protein